MAGGRFVVCALTERLTSTRGRRLVRKTQSILFSRIGGILASLS